MCWRRFYFHPNSQKHQLNVPVCKTQFYLLSQNQCVCVCVCPNVCHRLLHILLNTGKDSVYLSIHKTSDYTVSRGKQQANNVNMLNIIQCLYCVITCTVCFSGNLLQGRQSGKRAWKEIFRVMFGWLFVCELVLDAQSTSWGDWLVPSSSAELLPLICADFTQLSAFIYAWSRWRWAFPNCYFLVNRLTFCHQLWENFEFKTPIFPFLEIV